MAVGQRTSDAVGYRKSEDSPVSQKTCGSSCGAWTKICATWVFCVGAWPAPAGAANSVTAAAAPKPTTAAAATAAMLLLMVLAGIGRHSVLGVITVLLPRNSLPGHGRLA